ncbi:cobalt ECF transporter T component CbiQ [Desulfosarcina widdelii]|uniref:Cobalt ECF transporter T component CbiQ n=1 Tax=Desulfosarcina widdelii TaxID=947919 RepID=A0A5K7Z549_9BACT|nr:cobalt ECF transporter T component CbiQ [Desulfosarcina widdelii]BBO76896.1 cobalt ECF transporter T component CbiQ [Desulfosarcina widdelii]
MIDEAFAEGDGWLYRIDPRLRVLGAAGFAVVVAVAYDFRALLCALAISFGLVVSARLSLRRVVRSLLAALLFLALLWLVLPWSYEGPVWFEIGPVGVTRPGVVLCSQISLKTVALMTAFMALVATMTVDTLGHALSRLQLPDKMVYLLLITYRYLFVIEQEYQRLVRAMKIRNFRPTTSLHTYRTYAYLVGMLFVRALERARRVHCAMICRGFSGRFVSLRQFPSNPLNSVFSFGAIGAVGLLIVLEWVI